MTKHHIKGLPAREWESFFVAAKVLIEKLNDARSSHSKTVIMGQFLSPLVDSEVPIQVGGRTGKAKLCVAEGRAKEKRYYFEVWWAGDGEEIVSPGPESATDAQTQPRKGRRDSSSTSSTKQQSDQQTAGRRKKKAPIKQPRENRGAAAPSAAGNAEDW